MASGLRSDQHMATAATDAGMKASGTDGLESAVAANLTYVTGAGAGIRRRTAGTRFAYVDVDGKDITDPDVLLRIKALAVPPAWTDVWICPKPTGHIQATGRDARGRKQYRYHARWRQVRDEAKFGRLLDFGKALPRIRRAVQRDLALPGLPKRKVVATILKLLEDTLIRVGNDEYARSNASYGLTTLRDKHAQVHHDEIEFLFHGKSGKRNRLRLQDRRLARIVKQCRDIPGQRLFQYVDPDGDFHAIYSEDVNDYLRDVAGDGFSAKDFRTWAASVLALRELRSLERASTVSEARTNVAHAIQSVADCLGNTAAVCRRCYVHPAVVDAYLAGQMPLRSSAIVGLRADEAALMGLLGSRDTQKMTGARQLSA
jgi:DNA topoisomerase I